MGVVGYGVQLRERVDLHDGDSMKRFKYTADGRFVCTLEIDATDADLTPADPAIQKYLADLRRLLPIKRKGEIITIHECHGDRLAQWLRLLVLQGEGVELEVTEILEQRFSQWDTTDEA